MEEAQAPPKVSVLLISHNSAIPLRRCLNALANSTMKDQLEIIIVDLGSYDESPQLDSEYPQVALQRLPRNFGATKGLNVAARTANGEYLFFLDPEVELAPDTIAALVARLEADTEAAAVCPLLTNRDGEPVSHLNRMPTPESLAAAWRTNAPLPAVPLNLSAESVAVEYPGRSAILVRKHFVQAMNWFDERYGEHWADADLAMKARQAGKKIRLFPSIRATLHTPEDIRPASGNRPVFSADCALGAAHFISRYHGFFAGLRFRIGAILFALGRALASLLRARDIGFEFGRLVALVGGQKVDGTQGG